MTHDYYAEALQSYGSSTPFSHWGAQLAHFPIQTIPYLFH